MAYAWDRGWRRLDRAQSASRVLSVPGRLVDCMVGITAGICAVGDDRIAIGAFIPEERNRRRERPRKARRVGGRRHSVPRSASTTVRVAAPGELWIRSV